MCAIYGEVNFRSTDLAGTAVRQRMDDMLAHRGPDGSGQWEGEGVWLGHRRLAIIDLEGGRQPLANDDETVWIVFNGEIYNYKELRAQLLARGYSFRTRSDTEVIVRLYEEYGEKGIDRLCGMFAFALWDTRTRRLLLVRDRLGEKPLYYYFDGARLIFASEIKALLQHPCVNRTPDYTALDSYVTLQYIPPPRTAFAQIRKLPPAHLAVVSEQGMEIKAYWNLSYTPKIQAREEDLLDALHEWLSEAVKRRLVADVPVGAFLSGGIDSSLITALMANHSRGPVKTFSIGFDDQMMSELQHAQHVAEHFSTDHQTFVVHARAVDVLPRIIWHFDEPLADPAAIPTYYLAQMTAQHVKVALNGEGGDELFGGYERYLGLQWVHAYRRLPEALRKYIIGPLLVRMPDARHPRSLFRQAVAFNRLSLMPPDRTVSAAAAIFDDDLRQALYTPEFRSACRGGDALGCVERYFNDPAASEYLDRILHTDIMTLLPGELLAKVDRMTMAHGLEGRGPLLDHELAEFCARLPVRFKLRGLTSKYLLRKLAERLLPAKIARRRKQGFGVPIHAWLRNELRDMIHAVLLSDRARRRGMFRTSMVKQLIDLHQTGQLDYSQQLWTLLNLELWFQTYIDQSPKPLVCELSSRS